MALNSEMEMPPNSEADIDSLYELVSPRRADIVGDLVGSEVFLIQGDSLLLHCLSDGRIDFKGTSDRC